MSSFAVSLETRSTVNISRTFSHTEKHTPNHYVLLGFHIKSDLYI